MFKPFTRVNLSSVNYVKKVVFPLEVLPVVIMGSAVINGAIGFLVLLVGVAAAMGIFHWTVIFLPLVLLPLLLLTLGLSWFFASLGVYLRDIGQVINVFTTAVLFLSPIFYPLSIIPQEFQVMYHWNPISFVVEDIRRIFIWGQMPNWLWLLKGTLMGIAAASLGHAWFQKTRSGFADVI